MELRGDEKRIRALFFELSFDDQGRAPVFDHLWTRAEAGMPARTSVFNRPLAVIVMALITVAFSVGIWWRSKPAQTRSQAAAQIASQETREPPLPSTQTALKPASVTAPRRMGPPHQKARQNTLARHRQIERSLTHEAAMLSSWQSPTDIFLQTSASFVLKSLPQLNQSAKELELFLPKNIETTKESNQ